MMHTECGAGSVLDSNRQVGFRSLKMAGGARLSRGGGVVKRAVEPESVEPRDPGECGELDGTLPTEPSFYRLRLAKLATIIGS